MFLFQRIFFCEGKYIESWRVFYLLKLESQNELIIQWTLCQSIQDTRVYVISLSFDSNFGTMGAPHYLISMVFGFFEVNMGCN
jgi:hypothetical protein